MIFTSVQRLLALAGTTFTQLVRMKVFLFLLFFLFLFIGVNLFGFSKFLGPEVIGSEELILMKETTLGMMTLFCLIFSITATSLLIPRDGEDRILYTILCKPVPRWEYLAGKLLGVMALIIVVVLCMDVVFTWILDWRTTIIIEQQREIYQSTSYMDAKSIETMLARISSQGATWNLQLGVGTLIFKSLLLCSLTLFLSVISTSTIFSIIIAFSLYIIGLFQAEIKNLLFNSLESNMLQDAVKFFLSILFPDFRMYALMDSASVGKTIPLALFWKIGGISVAYMVMYLSAASLIFRKKEF